MRIAFTLFGGEEWTGGINYLVNLLSAIAELPDSPVEVILFAGEDVNSELTARLRPYLSSTPIILSSFTKRNLSYKRRKIHTLITQRDIEAETQFKKQKIDLVFQHATWYGFRFRLPTLVWIGDFQHRLYPGMFSKAQYLKREIGFQLLTRFGSIIMTSSETGTGECHKYYPYTRNKTMELPFVVRIPEKIMDSSRDSIRQIYNLPDRFFYLPNQFWKHKNHTLVIEALNKLIKSDKLVYIVISGKMSDIRNPGYPDLVLKKINNLSLNKYITVLGMVPYQHIFELMRASIGVINPSLYEGWSTTVEEAKSLGTYLLLSDIPVHREQARMNSKFFDVDDINGMAKTMWDVWNDYSQQTHINNEKKALFEIKERRQKFAEKFLNIASETVNRYNQD